MRVISLKHVQILDSCTPPWFSCTILILMHHHDSHVLSQFSCTVLIFMCYLVFRVWPRNTCPNNFSRQNLWNINKSLFPIFLENFEIFPIFFYFFSFSFIFFSSSSSSVILPSSAQPLCTHNHCCQPPLAMLPPVTTSLPPQPAPLSPGQPNSTAHSHCTASLVVCSHRCARSSSAATSPRLQPHLGRLCIAHRPPLLPPLATVVLPSCCLRLLWPWSPTHLSLFLSLPISLSKLSTALSLLLPESHPIYSPSSLPTLTLSAQAFCHSSCNSLLPFPFLYIYIHLHWICPSHQSFSRHFFQFSHPNALNLCKFSPMKLRRNFLETATITHVHMYIYPYITHTTSIYMWTYTF